MLCFNLSEPYIRTVKRRVLFCSKWPNFLVRKYKHFLIGEKSVGEISVWLCRGNVRSRKSPGTVGKKSGQGNTPLGKRPVGEMTVGETSIGELSVGETSIGEISVREPSGHLPTVWFFNLLMHKGPPPSRAETFNYLEAESFL